jgi:ABC-2 type transport system permease protein
MVKIWATVKKDFLILSRDRVGLIMMFAMPIVLVVVITSVQNSAFELVNENKLSMLVANQDKGLESTDLIRGLESTGMFRITQQQNPIDKGDNKKIAEAMRSSNAFVAIVIPENFSLAIDTKADQVASAALRGLGLEVDSSGAAVIQADSILLYYHPVLQQSIRHSVEGALHGVVELVQNKRMLKSLYHSLHQKEVPDSLQREILNNQIPISEIPVSRDGSRNMPNASQHNVPAWTIFAMFFVVISMGSSLVREKLSGSFLRLKSLPTSYAVALVSKQITYIGVTLVQAAVIFSIGIWVFPLMGLPRLDLPADKFALFLVTLICGCCATSFALCVGVFAQTQEQANGFGSAAVIILAAVGGLLVPSFAMPASFGTVMKMSPLHWCLEAYYGLFLQGGKLRDILSNILSLLLIAILLQAIAWVGLKRKNLI